MSSQALHGKLFVIIGWFPSQTPLPIAPSPCSPTPCALVLLLLLCDPVIHVSFILHVSPIHEPIPPPSTSYTI
ncbi:hypothetical protein BDQ17DRAFT_1372747 [Cyathus striatus]|nr:hypothetical protein BDQ17DRAFT_1372747 [Cyathus striatus]